MANGFNGWGDDPMNPLPYWGEGGTAAGVAGRLTPSDLTGYRTPEMDWADMMRNVGRTWQQRIPLANMQRQLMSRYQLGQPGGQSFGQFLSEMPQTAYAPEPVVPYWPSGQGYTSPGVGLQAQAGTAPLGGLRERAQLASEIGGMTEAEYAQTLAEMAGGIGGPQYRRAASLRGYFDPTVSGNVANQMNVANLLAQQRAGGGQWQGRMAGVIQSALQSLASERAARGFDQGTFLDWYLGETA
jgi:hypothetical protein